MQEETFDFKLDVSDESIKRDAMKVFWFFSGVTFVDIKEKGQVKVRGIFDLSAMGTLLYEIDESVDYIINSEQKPEENHISVISSISSYFKVPKVKDLEEIVVIFEFEYLHQRIKLAAMEVIWEFSGITSVEVVENRLVKVKGEKFNKLEMLTTLKKIDNSVKIVKNVEAKPEVKQSLFNNGVGSSKGPTEARVFGGGAGVSARGLEGAEKAKVQTPVNKKWDRAMRDFNLPQGIGFGGQINRQPQNNQKAKVQTPVNNKLDQPMWDFNLPQGIGFREQINPQARNKQKQQEKEGFMGQFQDWMKPKAEVKQAQHERDPEALYARFGPYEGNKHRNGNNPYARSADSSTSKTGETSQMQTQGSRGNSSFSSSSSNYQSQSGSQRTSSQHSQTSGSMRDQRSQHTDSRSTRQGSNGDSIKLSNRFSSLSRK